MAGPFHCDKCGDDDGRPPAPIEHETHEPGPRQAPNALCRGDGAGDEHAGKDDPAEDPLGYGEPALDVVEGEESGAGARWSAGVEIAGPGEDLIVVPVENVPEHSVDGGPCDESRGAPDQLDAGAVAVGEGAHGCGFEREERDDQQCGDQQGENDLPPVPVGQAGPGDADENQQQREPVLRGDPAEAAAEAVKEIAEGIHGCTSSVAGSVVVRTFD